MSADIAIHVENLSKRYTLNHQGSSGEGLRHALQQKLTAPLRWTRQCFSAPQLSTLNSQPSSEDFWALKDVNFEIKRGEVVGIVGRNGAGKSTLLKILSRITEPTSGRITLDGRVASLLEVGTGFHPELTGRENIFLNGAILGMARAEIRSKFDEIVAFAEVEKFLDTPVKRYSSGMYVRLAFSVAAHLEPEILIIDEVLAVGDQQFQEKCMGKMGQVSRAGKTVLFVSHNMGAIATLCTRAILLKGGQVERDASTGEIVDHYLNVSRRSTSRELKDHRLKGQGTEVRFVAIQAANGSELFETDAPLCFDLTIASDRAFSEVSIGCGIFRGTGECVGTLFTADRFSVSAGETVRLRLSIDESHLAPGLYWGGFSIGTGGLTSQRRDFDIVLEYPHFEVAPIRAGSLLASWQKNWGSIHFSSNRLEMLRDPAASMS